MRDQKELVPDLKVIRNTHYTGKQRTHDVLSEICNWTHPSLIVKHTASRGLGVFTTTDIRMGELLIVFGGRVLTGAQTRLMPPDLDMMIQIEEDLFFIPIDLDSLGVGERINHSCESNAGFSGQMSVVAIQNIAAGDEVCIDYATCDTRASANFKCECEAEKCRGRVTGNDWQIPEVQSRLGKYFQPFLKRRISTVQSPTRLVGNE